MEDVEETAYCLRRLVLEASSPDGNGPCAPRWYASRCDDIGDQENQKAIAIHRNGRARVALGAFMAQHGHLGGGALMQRGLEEERGRAA